MSSGNKEGHALMVYPRMHIREGIRERALQSKHLSGNPTTHVQIETHQRRRQ